MVKQQKVIKGTNGRFLLVLRARFVEDLGIEGGEQYCMRKGKGKTVIIDFDCREKTEEEKNIE